MTTPATATANREIVTIMQACDIVGVTRRTMYDWIAAGKVSYIRTAGGNVRIFADTLWRDGERRPSAQQQEQQES